MIEVAVDRHVYRKKSFELDSLRTNWDSLFTDLTNFFPRFLETDFLGLNPKDKYKFFVDGISHLVSNHTPKKKLMHPSRHRNPVIWWDEDCNKIKRLRKSAFKKWCFTLDLLDF